MFLLKRTPTKSNDWGTEPNATWYDLKRLAVAVGLSEVVVAALAFATRTFFGVQTALWVGLGIGTLVFIAFALIVVFSIFTDTVATFVSRRETQQRRRDRDPPNH